MAGAAFGFCLSLQYGSVLFVACAGLADAVEPYQMQPVGAAGMKAQGALMWKVNGV